MKLWHWITVIVLGLMIMGSSLYQYWARPERGDAAPDFVLPSLSGEQVSLSDYRGQVVLLHFWATWCGPCREEFPYLEALQQKMHGKPLKILAVSVDGEDAKAAVEQFQQYVPFSFTVLLDESGGAADAYHTIGVPESILIDPTGKIVGRLTGPQNWTSADSLSLFDQVFTRLPASNPEK